MWSALARALMACAVSLLLHVDAVRAAMETTQRAPLSCRFGMTPCKDGSECVLFTHVCDGERDCPDGSDEEDCASACSTDEFLCAHGRKCIERGQVCDGVAQCQDRSDEENCFNPDGGCAHRCDRNHCVPRTFICDGQKDCEDGSDENQCDAENGEKLPEGPAAGASPKRCRLGSRLCGDGSDCVLYSHVCDGEMDCRDGSDEDQCPSECGDSEFLCAHGRKCIERGQVCDGVAQCQDRSDEENCFNPDGGCAHRCDRNHCVPRSFICDGQKDCEDGSDENQCDAENGEKLPEGPAAGASPKRCPLGSRLCGDGSDCVLYSHVCDGEMDCRDGSDEDQCSSECGDSEFLCAHGRKCIERGQVCDGVAQCQDRSDEENCFNPDGGCAHRCDRNHCVPRSFICDGQKDCEDGSDENQCDAENGEKLPEGPAAGASPKRCPLGSRLCGDGSDCVLYSHVCDGEMDCRDGSDEDRCPSECGEGEFLCAHGRKCIERGQVCDGVAQCQDRSDENCFNPDGGCAHRCDRNHCVPRSFICDGQKDCEDGSDENQCGSASCSVQEFRCSSGQCVDGGAVCDGQRDCGDGSDEDGCANRTECSPGQHRCLHGDRCLLQGWLCDGEDDCGDASDEQNCVESVLQCGEFQWQCVSQTQCVPQSWRCDGTKDCRDESDEAGCEPGSCPPHQFQCGSTECLNPSLLCNGHKDCQDGSDEGGTCTTDMCADQSECAQHCYSTPTGRRCWCRAGYSPVGGGVECVDVDECTAACAHTCINSDGSFQCSCNHGYVLEPDGSSCEVVGEPSLLASVQTEMVLLGLRSSSRAVLLRERPVLSLDVDWREQRVYWASMGGDAVEWVSLDRKGAGTLVRGVRAESVAVDWVGRNLYWADGESRRINAVGLESDGAGPVVITDEDIEQPCALALLPETGLMFWSETGAEARLLRAGMDGSARQVVLRGPLRWPSGLAVDGVRGRLYWSDAGLACLGSATLDGDDVKLLQLTESPSPFAVAVFGDALYWSDARRGTVQTAQISSGKQRRVLLKQPGQALGVKGSQEKVVHAVLQSSVENPCASPQCSHLCVLAPGHRGVCKCPSALELDQDGLGCSSPDDSTFLLFLTPSAVSQVYLQGRHAAAGLQGWPEERMLSLSGVKRPAALAVREGEVYVWDAAQAAVRVFGLNRKPGAARGSAFGLRGDLLAALAVDWVTGSLVWSSAKRPGLLVTSARGEHTALLLQTGAGAVGSITLHPTRARLCFSNAPTPRTSARLECAHMDGQNRTTVWTEAVRPISLTLSNDGDTLYWTDTGLGIIASLGINGYKYREMKTEESVVAFALAGRVLVWVTNTDSTKCWFSDDHQSATLWFEGKTEVVDMKAFSKTSQQGSNFCSNKNGGCDHLCLVFPGGRTCRCAHGYVPVNGTGCTLASGCPVDTRACLRGDTCVPRERFCDGRPDCPDGSDEICVKVKPGERVKSGVATEANIRISTVAPSTARPRSYNRTVLVKNTDPYASHVPKSLSPMGLDSLDTVLVKDLDTSEPPGVEPAGVVPVWVEPAGAVPVDAADVKVGGVDSEACGARLCNGNGMCVQREGVTACECVSGYSGERCQEQVGGDLPGPVIYAAAGLCIAMVALGVVVGIIRRKKAASRRQAESVLREPSMMDLEKREDPEHTTRDAVPQQDVGSVVD